jgi:hypothetical protein
MSQLPVGFKGATDFLEAVILRGAMAKAVALQPWLATPVIGTIFRKILEWVIQNLILDKATDEATKIALATVYVIDQRKFDRTFIGLKMLERQNLTPEQKEAALVQAEKDMESFIRRGPVK